MQQVAKGTEGHLIYIPLTAGHFGNYSRCKGDLSRGIIPGTVVNSEKLQKTRQQLLYGFIFRYSLLGFFIFGRFTLNHRLLLSLR